MIFTGDVAIPCIDAVTFGDGFHSLRNEKMVINLVGSLIDSKLVEYDNILCKMKVFSDYDSINLLKQHINLQCCNIANNHVLDAADIKDSESLLKSLGIKHIGAGSDLSDAQREVEIEENGYKYIIVSFGWDGISCIYASETSQGVNPYTLENVIKVVDNLLSKYKNCRIVTLMHWNYETEKIPQPLDRELAHRLIDKGVYAVIGCHAHRVQPIEIYEGHPIVYGMGNFVFCQGAYHGGRLVFPDFCLKEIAIELTANDYFIHDFDYDRTNNVVRYIGRRKIEQAEFAEMDDKQYSEYFKLNRQHKSLPIFYYDDTQKQYLKKIMFIKHRQKLVSWIVRHEALKNIIKKFLRR